MPGKFVWSPRSRTWAVVAFGAIAVGAGLAYWDRSRRRRGSPGSPKRPPSRDTSKQVGASGVGCEDAEEEIEKEIHQGAIPATYKAPTYLTSEGIDQALVEVDGDPTEGGFGSVEFYATKSSPRTAFALKTPKDTEAGHRQMSREIDVLSTLQKLPVAVDNIVRVAEFALEPRSMLLMYREKTSLFDMLASGESIDAMMIKKVLDGVLTAVDGLHVNGFYHRDIKPENILIGQDGSGILVDFGLCITTENALSGEGLGDGTLEYAAPETRTEGWSLSAELYSVFASFVESIVGRSVFGGKELFTASASRLDSLDSIREEVLEDVEDFREELEEFQQMNDEQEGTPGTPRHSLGRDSLGGDSVEDYAGQLHEALVKRDHVNLQLVRLGKDVGDWEPDAICASSLLLMGDPLSFMTEPSTAAYKEATEADRNKMEVAACLEAKDNPYKLFESDWVNWLPGPFGIDCSKGLIGAIGTIMGEGALDPEPSARPQTVEASRKLLLTAVEIFQQERRQEEEAERDDE